MPVEACDQFSKCSNGASIQDGLFGMNGHEWLERGMHHKPKTAINKKNPIAITANCRTIEIQYLDIRWP